jgi:hypothetical protein
VILDSVFGRKAAVILDRKQQRSWILFSKNGTIFELNLGGILSMMLMLVLWRQFVAQMGCCCSRVSRSFMDDTGND